jgi:hypothetical protein
VASAAFLLPGPCPALDGPDAERGWIGLARARVSNPQRLSGGIGALLAHQPADWECKTLCDWRGPFVAVEPGLAGAQLGAGYAVVLGEKRNRDFFLSEVYLAYGVRAALLRTWGNASLDPSAQTFVGVEGDFTVIQVNFSLGLFRPIRTDSNADADWLVSAGIGWGF